MAEIGLFEAMYTARALRRFKPDPVSEVACLDSYGKPWPG